MGYPVTDEEILPIIRLIKEAHGKDREELMAAAINILMYLVYSKAKGYKETAFYDDLLQEGRTALILSINKFDESRGSKFFWFANWYLKLRFKSALKTYLFNPRDVYKANKQRDCVDEFYFDDDPVEAKEIRETIMAELNRLDERSREIIILKYGLNGNKPLTFREIGELKNVSRQRVEQIKSKAIQKLGKKRNIKELYGGINGSFDR